MDANHSRFVTFLLMNYLIQAFGQPVPQRFSALQEPIADVSYWTYGDGDHGPRYWPKLFTNYCAGRYQSPINIQKKKTVYDLTLKELTLHDPLVSGSKFEVHNNGHAVEVNVVGEYFVTNGGLERNYKTAQFHFHWGRNSLRGSEHTIGGKSAPLEMHIVNWNHENYSTIDEAAKHPEGLAVLSVLFDISEEDNPKFESIIRILHRVRDPDQDVLVTIPSVSLREFLPKSSSRYFRYSGSLTTPTCSESVIWTVFEQRQTISERQLNYFRLLRTSSLHAENVSRRRVDGDEDSVENRFALVDNFRPVQDLNGRKVYRSFRNLRVPSSEDDSD